MLPRCAGVKCFPTYLPLCIAKCFSLVSDGGGCLASSYASTERGERNRWLLLPRGDGMTMQVRFNALAALLSFGFVIAVVLGMI